MLIAALLMSGCAPATLEERLASSDPKVRVGAAYELEKVPGGDSDVRLIHLLMDEDAAVRLFSSIALKKRHDRGFGFLAEGPLADRAAAVRKWIAWCEETLPATRGRFDDMNGRLEAIEGNTPPGGAAATD
jgi:hypothetical protein